MGFELHLNNWPNTDILALALFSVTIKGSRGLARTRLNTLEESSLQFFVICEKSTVSLN